MDVRLYWIWLSQIVRAGSPNVSAWMRQWKHPRALYEADAETLRRGGLPPEAVLALLDKSLEKAQTILRETESHGFWVLTPDDALYPSVLLQLPDFPPVLYGAGDWRGWEDVPAIAVVGSRHISEEGFKRTVTLTAGLAAGGMAIVSGGAVGGDTAAIEAVLALGGTCVSVQACGLDVNYPVENEALRARLLQNGGVLLTEYPLGVKPGRGTFQVRNRLIAGLALGTLVTEAQTRSGTLITAHCARDQGRDVFAVPGDEVLCGGCHRLIREGALLVTSSTDVLAEYLPLYAAKLDLEAARAAEQDMRRRWQPEDPSLPPEPPAPKKRRAAKKPAQPVAPAVPTERPPMPDGLSPKAQQVYGALDAKPKLPDELAAETGLTPAEVLGALTELEIFGCAQNFAGRQYAWKG